MAKKELTYEVGGTFTTDSLARAISAKSAYESGKSKYSISESAELINLFKEAVADALRAGQKVQLTGFMTITPTYRKEREGNNVTTGGKVTIPASVAFTAKTGKMLKDIAKALPDDIVAEIKRLGEANEK